LEENLSVKTVGGSFDAFHVLPSVTPAPVVVVLQEIFGVNADMRRLYGRCCWTKAHGHRKVTTWPIASPSSPAQHART